MAAFGFWIIVKNNLTEKNKNYFQKYGLSQNCLTDGDEKHFSKT
ncbi:hypothetical protein A33Q_4243 [Indibacter alkaliphilus LW1]|uniref:Uncharacterized protein n=1 Tax=Indibacter alkaliphilus (strain CCUG 57479 / KCTC 22604 / LW1) TaxID=1189612 RepID=S2D520_INDAL|nr:hypothetical protein A33Q_4243 [Indibacter alkaliphilus LW1]